MNGLRILCLTLMVYQGKLGEANLANSADPVSAEVSKALLSGLCCTKKKNPTNENVWQRLVGQDITTNPYSGTDSPVDTCNQLNTAFESGACWSNGSPP